MDMQNSQIEYSGLQCSVKHCNDLASEEPVNWESTIQISDCRSGILVISINFEFLNFLRSNMDQLKPKMSTSVHLRDLPEVGNVEAENL